ncbi:MAG: hypothetical protein IPJ41_16955 [Phycisphaerales bacterium]|nr:hypothetical protein [Phycisphaerales bacterium]
MNSVLEAAGLREVQVQSVSPVGDQAIGGDGGPGVGRRVQTLRIVLEPVSLSELGAFLGRWRHDQALWIVTGVELGAAREGGRYRATIIAGAVYVPSAPRPSENSAQGTEQ